MERIKASEELSNSERFAFYNTVENVSQYVYGTRGGWEKDRDNPIFGDGLGVCFDVSIIKEKDIFKMWFSWRTERSIGYTESLDGKNWNKPRLAISPIPGSTWEADEINRPSVIEHMGKYYMWYSGQMKPYREEGVSVIGMATSDDGIFWQRFPNPVLIPSCQWEQHALMCPHVLFDAEENLFKMWYSGGSNHEPDAIGYATSPDGLHWERIQCHPIMTSDPSLCWERHKVLGCQVLRYGGYYYMFYIGHMHEERAAVGLARSNDGICDWQRYPYNPIIAPEKHGWDDMAIYKPFVLFDGKRWMLWFNGATFDETIWADEKIGLAYLHSENLWNV